MRSGRPIGPPLIWKHEQAWWEHWKTIGSQVSATRKKNYIALDGRRETSELGRSIRLTEAQGRPSRVNAAMFGFLELTPTGSES